MNNHFSALIGLGNIGYKRNLRNNKIESHFEALKNFKDLNFKYLCDTNSKLLNSIKGKNFIKFIQMNELLKKEGIKLFIVSTPTDTHYDILKELLKYKTELVFIEKPISNNTKKTIKILKEYKKNKINLYVNFFRRFNASYINLKKNLVSKKIIGDISTVNLTYNRGFYNNCLHYLDLFFFIFGPPKSMKIINKEKSYSIKDDIEVDLILIYKNKKIFINSAKSKNYIVEEMIFFGSKGKIEIKSDFKINYYSKIKDKYFPFLDNYKLYFTDNILFDKNSTKAIRYIYNKSEINLDKNLSDQINFYEFLNKNKL